MDDVYMYLPSNSSKDFYPKNTISRFCTHLEQPLQLDRDQWEVALTEISYPPYLEEDNVYDLHDISDETRKNVNVVLSPKGTVIFPKKDFMDLTDLYKTIKNSVTNDNLRKAMLRLFQWILLRENQELNNFRRSNHKWNPQVDDKSVARNKLTFTVSGNTYTIAFPVKTYKSLDELVTTIRNRFPSVTIALLANSTLRNLLYSDLKDAFVVTPPEEYVISKEPVYVYSDIVGLQYVGDKMARVLRIIQFPSDKHHEIFVDRYYKPVDMQIISDIEVTFRTQYGDLVHFSDSSIPSIVVLHFRRKRFNI